MPRAACPAARGALEPGWPLPTRPRAGAAAPRPPLWPPPRGRGAHGWPPPPPRRAAPAPPGPFAAGPRR
eukprot:9480836-Pyramimonas_sp.AAC.1